MSRRSAFVDCANEGATLAIAMPTATSLRMLFAYESSRDPLQLANAAKAAMPRIKPGETKTDCELSADCGLEDRLACLPTIAFRTLR